MSEYNITLKEMIEQVASQMMKCGKHGKLKATDRQKENFKNRHEKLIIWTIKHTPKCSTAVQAVIVKSFIKYEDKNRVAQFSICLQKALFEGETDPVYQLWRFIQKHRGKDTVAAYTRTVHAIRSYMNRKQIKQLNPASSDIFDWDEDWTVPDNLLKVWNPDFIPVVKENLNFTAVS